MQNSITEARAISKMIRVSPRKLNLVVKLIKNMKVSQALIQLQFSKKRIALDVKKCLQSAASNAENNFGLDIDDLVVNRAIVGKSLVIKRGVARARGRGARISKFFSNLSITVSKVEEN